MQRPAVCATHQAYRSEHLAIVAAARHAAWSCAKCRRGKVWHVFRCPYGAHFHTAHNAPMRLSTRATG